jgi:hypothetical protein
MLAVLTIQAQKTQAHPICTTRRSEEFTPRFFSFGSFAPASWSIMHLRRTATSFPIAAEGCPCPKSSLASLGSFPMCPKDSGVVDASGVRQARLCDAGSNAGLFHSNEASDSPV